MKILLSAMRKLLFYWWLYLQLKATFPFLAIIFTLRAYKSNVTWCSVYRYFKTYFTLPSFNLLSLHFYTTGKISSFTLSEIKYSVDIAFLFFSILLSFSKRNVKRKSINFIELSFSQKIFLIISSSSIFS